MDQLIPFAVTIQFLDPLTLQAKNPATLGAGFKFDFNFAIDGWYFDLGAQYRIDKAHIKIKYHIVAISLEFVMFGFLYDDQQVTRYTSGNFITLARKTKLHAVAYTCRNIDWNDLFLDNQTSCIRFSRLFVHQLPTAATSRTGARRYHLAQHRIYDFFDLSRAITGRAILERYPIGNQVSLDLDLLLYAVGNFCQVKF